MKAIIILFTITFLQNDRIIGIWKSIDDDDTKYLNFKSNGDLIEVGKNNIIKYDFIKKNNFIQIEMENGNITEQTYYINKDILFKHMSKGLKKLYLCIEKDIAKSLKH